jgi:hypothetical protein
VSRRAALLVVVAGAIAVGPAAASGRGSSEAAGERIQARLTYTETDRPGLVAGARLKITVDGHTLMNRPLPGCALCFIRGNSLHISDLDGDARDEVAVTLKTTGAHCCSVLDVSRRVGSRFVGVSRSFRGCALTLRDLDRDGRLEVVACDYRFNSLFTSYADSVAPARIWEFDQGSFRLVTRRFAAHVRADADAAFKAYRRLRTERPRREVRGALAAWAADECLLGEAAQVWPRLKAARKAGELVGSGGPQGAAYVNALRAQLVRLGYLPGTSGAARGPRQKSA